MLKTLNTLQKNVKIVLLYNVPLSELINLQNLIL
jgi:hypothetical protein